MSVDSIAAQAMRGNLWWRALLSPTVPTCLAMSEHKMEVPLIWVQKRFFLVECDGGGAPITLDQEKPFLDPYCQINEPLLTTFYTYFSIKNIIILKCILEIKI